MRERWKHCMTKQQNCCDLQLNHLQLTIKQLKHFYIYIVGLLLMASCTVDTACHTTKKIRAGVGLDSMWVWNEEHTAITITDKWDTVSVRGIGSDSVIYNHAKNIKSFSLSLRADTNITQFEIEWKHQLDTLSIRHINDYQYISLACGCVVYHVIDSVWSRRHFIDSTYIVESDVQAIDAGHEIENVRLVVSEK